MLNDHGAGIERIESLFISLYPEAAGVLNALIQTIKTHKKDKEKLKKTGDTTWLYEKTTVGMMLYVDRFSETLDQLESKKKHFKKLGINLVHFMPLLKPREGENDGGYAVADYKAVDPKIGDLEALKTLVKSLHKSGIRVCIDYVVNHTADDHEWALKAKAGDLQYQNFYRMYDDEETPKAYEKHLLEVFPKVAPGNFTYLKTLDKWVMTTFYPFQWDLNYDNPEVAFEMIKHLLFYNDLGIDMIRLDAIPYVWKQLGTDSRNLPHAHSVMALFRAVVDYCAPEMALLGEAIVSPETIVTYFGSESKPECHVLYNASYMVEIWNAIATRDARHLSQMRTFEIPKDSVWINYARCHDDIGWGLDAEKTRNLGFDPGSHKQFLIDFYLGAIKDSFSKGELYEYDPKTGDARNSGTLASLAGLEKALLLKSKYQIELALKRIALIHALFVLRRGIPMLYSGDEVAQLNDYGYKNTLEHAHDSRWLHRPKMDWEKVKRVDRLETIEAIVFHQIKALIGAREEVLKESILFTSNKSLLMVHQTLKNKAEPRLLIYNLSEDRQWLYTVDLKRYGIEGLWTDVIQGMCLNLNDECVLLGPCEFFVIEK